MKKVKDNTNAKFQLHDMKTKQHLQQFKMHNLNFEQIEKTLEDFLDKKREEFFRFYFLSNDELLEVLSTTRSVLDLPTHFSKVFEGNEYSRRQDSGV